MSRRILYKFMDEKDGVLCSRYDGSPWTAGEWRDQARPTKPCVGLNASELIPDAWYWVRGAVLAEVEVRRHSIPSDGKRTCESMRVLRAWRVTDPFALPGISKARAALDKARAAYDKAWAAHDKAGWAHDKARAAYGKARAALGKARAAYDKARAALDKAWAAYENDDKRHDHDLILASLGEPDWSAT